MAEEGKTERLETKAERDERFESCNNKLAVIELLRRYNTDPVTFNQQMRKCSNDFFREAMTDEIFVCQQIDKRLWAYRNKTGKESDSAMIDKVLFDFAEKIFKFKEKHNHCRTEDVRRQLLNESIWASKPWWVLTPLGAIGAAILFFS